MGAHFEGRYQVREDMLLGTAEHEEWLLAPESTLEEEEREQPLSYQNLLPTGFHAVITGACCKGVRRS